MDGFVYDGCGIIAAGVNAGFWYRAGAPIPPAPPTPPPTPPPSPHSKGDADVVWGTPSNDVTGSMPLGNGRLGVNVWADATSTIGLLISHVDALDENSVLSKLGRVLVRVVPPTAQPEEPLVTGNYTISPGAIGPQPPLVTVHCLNHSGCPAVAAAACDRTPSCLGFGLSPIWNNGLSAELYTGPLSEPASSPPWTLWVKPGATPGPPTPNAQPFRVEYRLSNMTVRIQLPVAQNVTIEIWVDATTDAVRVSSTSARPHKLEATVEVWRNATAPYPFETSWCPTSYPNVTRHADTVVVKPSSILFYHRVDPGDSAMWDADLVNQDMPSDLPNARIGTTFGGLLSGGGDGALVQSGPMRMTSTTASTAQFMSVGGAADVYPEVQDFVIDLEKSIAAPTNRSAHALFWSTFWANSDISITPSASPNDTAVADEASTVTLMDRVSRAAFYSMALGKHAIKFNAYGIYSAYAGPGQEDYRVWGECQWVRVCVPYLTVIWLLSQHTPAGWRGGTIPHASSPTQAHTHTRARAHL